LKTLLHLVGREPADGGADSLEVLLRGGGLADDLLKRSFQGSVFCPKKAHLRVWNIAFDFFPVEAGCFLHLLGHNTCPSLSGQVSAPAMYPT